LIPDTRPETKMERHSEYMILPVDCTVNTNTGFIDCWNRTCKKWWRLSTREQCFYYWFYLDLFMLTSFGL